MALSDEMRAAQVKTAYEMLGDTLNMLFDNDKMFDGTSVLYALSMHLGEMIASLPLQLHGPAFDKVGSIVSDAINREVESGRSGKAQLLDEMEKYRPN